MIDLSGLDNPVWSSLHARHRAMRIGHGLAARYPGEVSPLAATADGSRAAFDALRHLVAPGEVVGVVGSAAHNVPDNWDVVRERWIDQMVCHTPPPMPDAAPEDLRFDDVEQMLALASATEPGPFERGTIRMGRFKGIKNAEGELMAMAGERMHLDGLTEVSAVCTSPQFQGRGLARRLVSFVAARLASEGLGAFLHVKGENAASLLYEKLGFRVRRQMHFAVIRRPKV